MSNERFYLKSALTCYNQVHGNLFTLLTSLDEPVHFLSSTVSNETLKVTFANKVMSVIVDWVLVLTKAM